ncbi:hypothetical protein CVT24_012021 [Panaeolus cyanescens]|uniref:F-box domain-containing protein n=1 Tax=Panaeolus cyanescens TaxID=181874 RepID=A0A409YNE0_9AGAR|nr:hypothetical protein CVT24_012021 [Panaeolus cyanescens]
MFPVEIIELIINHLAVDDNRSSALVTKDLLACSLVCKPWVPLLQKHIFARPTVFGGTDSKAHLEGGLAYALSNNPALSRYITALKYSFSSDENACDTSFSQFLRLPRLQTLVMCGPVGSRNGISFKEPKAPNHACKFGFRSMLTHYLSFGSLTALTILWVKDLPFYTILSSPNLERLQLEYCSIEVVGDPPPTTSLKYFRPRLVTNFELAVFRPGTLLETLSLDGTIDESLIGSGEYDLTKVFPDLKRLYIAGVAPRRCMGKVLETVPPLEHLTFEITYVKTEPCLDSVKNSIRRCAKSLKVLNLYLTVTTLCKTVVDSLHDLFLSIKGHNVLDSVEIMIHYRHGYLHPIYENIGHTIDQWERFSTMMSTDSDMSFPSLKYIYLCIIFDDPCYFVGPTRVDRAEVIRYRKDFRNALSTLESHPVIQLRRRVRFINGRHFIFPRDVDLFFKAN